MRQLLIIFMLLVAITGYGQQIISPGKFVQYPSTPLQHEFLINAAELPNQGGYLFPMTSNIPYNLTNAGNRFSSAFLLRTDYGGNIRDTFSIAPDTIRRSVYRGMQAQVLKDEVLFFVINDSAVINGNGETKFLLCYHLDTADLSLRIIDTFKNIVPSGRWVAYWHMLLLDDVFYNVIAYNNFTPPFVTYSSSLFSFRNGHADNITVLPIDPSTVPGIIGNSLTIVNSLGFNTGKDSLELFVTVNDSASHLIQFRFITVDTSLQHLTQRSMLLKPRGRLKTI